MRTNKGSLLAMAPLLAIAAPIDVSGGKIRHIGDTSPSKPPRDRKYPQMITSTKEEIEAWNSNVKTRQVLRNKKAMPASS